MKERRAAGATHSFRLSRSAADMVDRHPPFRSLEGRPYPRSLGGKSKLVSDAIVWCYSSERNVESYHDLMKSRAWWVKHCEEIEAREISAPPVGGWRSILHRIRYWMWRSRP